MRFCFPTLLLDRRGSAPPNVQDEPTRPFGPSGSGGWLGSFLVFIFKPKNAAAIPVEGDHAAVECRGSGRFGFRSKAHPRKIGPAGPAFLPFPIGEEGTVVAE